jgi:hypothetical protein
VSERPLRVVCVSDRAYIDAPGAVPGDSLSVLLTVGKVYEVVGEQMGMYSIRANGGFVVLVPKSRFQPILDLGT